MTTHYLRLKTDSADTLVDLEATKDDLSCQVCIPAYSVLLLSHPDRAAEVIADFESIQEIRGAYWEGPQGRMTGETPNQIAERCLKELAVKYDLWYITD